MRITVAAAVLCALSACSQDHELAPHYNSAGGEFAGTGAAGDDTSGAGRGNGGAAGLAAGGSGGPGGTNAAAGSLGILVGGGPSLPTPECDPDTTWSNPTPLSGLDTSDPEELLGVTPDELTIVWLRTEADEDKVYYADRNNRREPFSTAVELPLPNGWVISGGVALSADGLRLVLLRDDERAFGELTRTAKSAPFGSTVDEVPFGRINASWIYDQSYYTAPVLSADDDRFYYVRYVTDTFVDVSARQDDATWEVGWLIADESLGGQDGASKLPCSISHDGLTIFYWNEGEARAEALWRQLATEPFYEPVSLGQRNGARPNTDCSRLYSTSVASGAGDVIVETAE